MWWLTWWLRWRWSWWLWWWWWWQWSWSMIMKLMIKLIMRITEIQVYVGQMKTGLHKLFWFRLSDELYFCIPGLETWVIVKDLFSRFQWRGWQPTHQSIWCLLLYMKKVTFGPLYLLQFSLTPKICLPLNIGCTLC